MTQTQEHNVPTLRFPEFSGEWSKKRFHQIAQVTSGGTPTRSRKDYWGGSIPWVTTSEIKENIIETASQTISELGLQNSSAKLFQPGTILLAMYGQGQTRGRAAILGIEAATNQACAAITPNTEVNSKFLFQDLVGRYGKLRDLANDGGQKNLSGGLIKDLDFAFPTLPEQQKIAAFLSSVDRRIAQLGQKKALLQRYKKGMMQKLFSQELRFKDAQGDDFPDWEEKRLGEFNELVHGDGDWILSQDISKDGEFKIVQLGNIGLGNFVEKPMKTLTLKKFTELRGTKIYCGDLLINRMVDSNLYCCLMNKEGDFVTSVDVCWIRENQYFNNYFLMSLMLYTPNQRKLLSLSSGSGRVRISKKNLFNKFSFMLPSLKEQQKIADFLSSIDRKIDLVATELDHAKTFKKGLLQQMFI